MVPGHSFIQPFSISKALIYRAYTACSRIRFAKVGLEQVLHDADLALYRAKAEGRNRVVGL